jgi:hypothetical protein
MLFGLAVKAEEKGGDDPVITPQNLQGFGEHSAQRFPEESLFCLERHIVRIRRLLSRGGYRVKA